METSKENKTASINIRVSENEKEMFVIDANSQDKSISELAREKLGFEV